MSFETNVYLLILGSRSGFKECERGMLRIDTNDGSQIIDYPYLSKSEHGLPRLPEVDKLILCYDETNISNFGFGEQEGNDLQKRCRELLYNILVNIGKKVCIFYHRGGDFNELAEIREDFSKEYWGEANIMPYSIALSAFPWMKEIGSVCTGFFEADELSFDDAFKKLDSAWSIAFSYYNVDQAIQVLLETLFPLYVDLSNREYSDLNERDFKAAFKAAEGNIKSALSHIGIQGEYQDLKRTLVDVKELLDEDKKRLAGASVTLLGKLERLTLDKSVNFLKMFDKLSEVYTLSLKLPCTPENVKQGKGDVQ